MATLESPCIALRSGGYFHFLAPEKSPFSIDDIAHALAHLCRFNGHCRTFYSVAQHSVLVSRHLPRELRYAGLLHDAAEAFLGDVTFPLKQLLPDFKALEQQIEQAVFARFGLPRTLPPAIKAMDLCALATEQRDLMDNRDDWPMLAGITPWEERIVPLTPQEARQAYLSLYAQLKL